MSEREGETDWGAAAVWIVVWLVILTLAILFAGTPDLMDAIIARVGGTA